MSSIYFISHHGRQWHFHAWIHGLGGAYQSHDVDLPSNYTSEAAALTAAIDHAEQIAAPPPIQVYSLSEKGGTRLLFAGKDVN